jgi:hypothetical protein
MPAARSCGRDQSSDGSSAESSAEFAAVIVWSALRRVLRAGFDVSAAGRDMSWASTESECSRASVAASLSSLFFSRSLATVRSSFATWASSSALFGFGVRTALLATGCRFAIGFVALPDFASGGFLALVDPSGRPGLRFGASPVLGVRGFRVEAFVFVARAMIVSCWGHAWVGEYLN